MLPAFSSLDAPENSILLNSLLSPRLTFQQELCCVTGIERLAAYLGTGLFHRLHLLIMKSHLGGLARPVLLVYELYVSSVHMMMGQKIEKIMVGRRDMLMN